MKIFLNTEDEQNRAGEGQKIGLAGYVAGIEKRRVEAETDFAEILALTTAGEILTKRDVSEPEQNQGHFETAVVWIGGDVGVASFGIANEKSEVGVAIFEKGAAAEIKTIERAYVAEIKNSAAKIIGVVG